MIAAINHEYLNTKAVSALIIAMILPLLLTHVLLISLGYLQLAGTLLDINMILIGLYFVLQIRHQYPQFSRPIFCTLVLALVLINLFNLNYLPVVKLNLLLLLVFLSVNWFKKRHDENQKLLYIFSFPFAFTLIDMVDNQRFFLSAFARNVWDAGFIITGIWLLAKYQRVWLTLHAYKWILAVMMVYIFILAQFPISTDVILKPIYLFGNTLDAGNVVRTSHLSIFAAPVLIAAIYLCFNKPWPAKIAALPIIYVTSLFILYTSWRPLWLGLAVGGFIGFMLCYPKKRKLIVLLMFFSQVVLLSSNVGHYRDRMLGLWGEKHTEERNFIWHDAWAMQQAASPERWVLGHGLMSYLESFKAYSRFYKTPQTIALPPTIISESYVLNAKVRNSMNKFRVFLPLTEAKKSQENNSNKYFATAISFSSPHHLLLDLIYTCGLLGLIIVATYYFKVLRRFTSLAYSQAQCQMLCCAMITTLICTLIVNGLNFPFFKYFNILPTAYVLGVLFYLHEYNKQHLTA